MLGLWKRSVGFIRKLARTLGALGGWGSGGQFLGTQAAFMTTHLVPTSSPGSARTFADDLDQPPSPSTNHTEALALEAVRAVSAKQEEVERVAAEVRRLICRLDEQPPEE